MPRSLPLIFILLVTLVSSCSSRRLEYQQLTSETPSETLVAVPEDSHFGNTLTLPDVIDNEYSYAPHDTDALVPRPVATFIQEPHQAGGSILLGDRIVESDDVVIHGEDSRQRPAIRAALPIAHVDKKLHLFLTQRDIAYNSIDPQQQEMTECSLLYQLTHFENALFFCLQTTLDFVYIAAQAEDADDNSLDEQANTLLGDFTKKLL